MLSRLVLDRNTDIPLFRQLRAAIEMRIIDGTLPDGTNLPSIRWLANKLSVANVTVIQAYNDLQARGFIKSVPKRGFFVTSGSAAGQPTVSTERLDSAIDTLLEIAREDGIGELVALRIAMQRLREREERSVIIAIVGYQNASLEERVAYTQAALGPVSNEVIGLSFEELKDMVPTEKDVQLRAIDTFMVSVGETEYASSLLNNHASRILPMTRTLREDVIDTISNQPDSAKFGIIASNAEYSDRMIAELRRLKPDSIVACTAVVHNDDEVKHVLEKADIILIGSEARHHLKQNIPPTVQLVQFHFVPDSSTLQRLRNEVGFSAN